MGRLLPLPSLCEWATFSGVLSAVDRRVARVLNEVRVTEADDQDVVGNVLQRVSDESVTTWYRGRVFEDYELIEQVHSRLHLCRPHDRLHTIW